MAKANKRTIPEVRERLLKIAEEHGVNEIYELVDEMYRSAPVKRAKNRSRKMTPALAAEIRRFAAANPDLHQQDIANAFGLNHGRVSEALNRRI